LSLSLIVVGQVTMPLILIKFLFEFDFLNLSWFVKTLKNDFSFFLSPSKLYNLSLCLFNLYMLIDPSSNPITNRLPSVVALMSLIAESL
jgi:hypothetical protein